MGPSLYPEWDTKWHIITVYRNYLNYTAWIAVGFFAVFGVLSVSRVTALYQVEITKRENRGFVYLRLVNCTQNNSVWVLTVFFYLVSLLSTTKPPRRSGWRWASWRPVVSIWPRSAWARSGTASRLPSFSRTNPSGSPSSSLNSEDNCQSKYSWFWIPKKLHSGSVFFIGSDLSNI